MPTAWNCWYHGCDEFQLDLKLGEGIWAKRSKVEPIRDRAHHVKAVNYVADHEDRGALLYLDPRLREILDKKKR